MKKLFLFLASRFTFSKPDPTASWGELIVSSIVPIGMIIFILFAQLSGLGVFNNCFAESAMHQGAGWHVFAVLLQIFAFVAYWGYASDTFNKPKFSGAAINILFGVLTLVSILSHTAFSWWFNVCQ